MFSSLAANPDQAASMLSNNPMFAGNPAMQQQMQNPSVQQLMGNPEALQAIMQIQQGMDRLRTAAPEVYNSMGLPTLPPMAGVGSAGASTTTPTSPTNSAPTTTGNNGGNTTGTSTQQ